MGRVKYKKHSSNMGDNPDLQASTCIAHIFLFGTSAWALKHSNTDTPLVFGAFSFLIGHSLLGAKQYGHPSSNDVVKEIFKITTILGEAAPLPMLISELYVRTNVSSSYAYLPVASALVPVITNFIDEEYMDNSVDAVYAVNIIALSYSNYNTFDSPWVWGMIALASLNQFVFRKLASKYEVPKMDFVALGLSFFCIFAVNCLSEVE